MKRLRVILLLCLVAVLLLVACRREENQAATDTLVATATPAADRGEMRPSSEEDTDTLPAATQAPAVAATTATESRGSGYTILFAAQPDGFGFRNYGVGYPEGDFTIAELRALFGDAVCSRIEGEECIPTAEAQQWIADRNADMKAGHCIGFTVTSYRFFEGEYRPATFTAAADAPFDIAQKAPIMRTIALNGSLYWAESVWSKEVSGTPREIIDALIALGEPADLSIFLPGLVGGHSLLAYGVEQTEPQTYHILVYDNNLPGEKGTVEVDYEANTWRYAQGAVNPNEATTPYEGDATTETLRFIPLSAYETATCPFCPPEAEEAETDEAITLLSFLGQGEVLVETALGSIGSVAGEIINEIPGARLIFDRGQLAGNDTPDIALPGNTDFTVQFNGLERVSSLNPNFSLVIDHLAPDPQNNQLTVALDAQSVDYQAGGEQSPLLNVTIRQEDTSYRIALLGIDLADGQGLSVGVAESGERLELRSQDVAVTDATLLITRLTNEEETIYATTALDIQDDGGVALDIAAWDGSGSIDLYADANGDGSYDERPRELRNEPLEDVLQKSDADEVSSIIGNLSPFLGEQGLESMLAALSEQDLTGQEIGQILLPLQLTNEQLIRFISTLSLPVPELGELLFALRLEPERQDEIIAGLELEEADETELRAYLTNLALYHEILSDWDFLNTNDLTQLIALLNARGLTTEQLGQLLQRIGLSIPEIEQVVGGLDLSAAELADVAEELDISIPATHTPTLTATATPTGTVTATATSTISGTVTLTPSVTISVTPMPMTSGTPSGSPDAYPGTNPTPSYTPDPDAYPGINPTPSHTPDPDAYPGADPTPTGSPDAYPDNATPTPAFQSSAYCIDDDLRIIAEEPTWIDTLIEVWSDEELLFSGTTGREGEPFIATVLGPGTWTNLYIEATDEPTRVPLGTITCP